MTTAPGIQREDLAGLAIHEAAHAVMFAVGALPFHHVELTPGDPVTAGAVRAYREPPTRPRALYAAIVAGAIAEHMFTGTPLEEIARTCAAQDMARADDIAKDWPPALVTALWARAELLVARHANAISRVAAELCVRRTLTEAEVAEIVHNPQGV